MSEPVSPVISRPTANARTHARGITANDDSPFAIPDSASARYRIDAVNRKLIGRVAIIGLGGTGSFLLDLLAKTWVTQIHLYDGDQLLNHNLFRSPESPEPALLKAFPLKVNYYAQVYGRMHTGITAHPIKVTAANVDELAGFDFVLGCELIKRGQLAAPSAAATPSLCLMRLAVPLQMWRPSFVGWKSGAFTLR